MPYDPNLWPTLLLSHHISSFIYLDQNPIITHLHTQRSTDPAVCLRCVNLGGNLNDKWSQIFEQQRERERGSLWNLKLKIRLSLVLVVQVLPSESHPPFLLWNLKENVEKLYPSDQPQLACSDDRNMQQTLVSEFCMFRVYISLIYIYIYIYICLQ